MTAKIYTRLSRDKYGQTSTTDQERECRTLARRLGIDNIEVFPEDPGTSAYKDVLRPAFDRLINSLQSGDVVLAWAIDRATRHGMEETGKVLRILEERGARLVTVSDGVDTAIESSELNTGLRPSWRGNTASARAGTSSAAKLLAQWVANGQAVNAGTAIPPILTACGVAPRS